MSSHGAPVLRPMAEERAIDEAAIWYARLRDEAATPALEQAWREWLAADAAHRDAWQRVEAISGQFQCVPGALAMPVLGITSSRRAVVRGLAVLAVTGVGGLAVYRRTPWREWSSDYRTATGERQEIDLADGSRLILNTRTALDGRFTATHRKIVLHVGEIHVSTQPDPILPPRPFLVRTAHGDIRALGTRFNVRLEDGYTSLSVLEKAVEAQPLRAPELRARVGTGQQMRFSTDEAGPIEPIDAFGTGWESGYLVVIDQPLERVLAELSRYHSGRLVADPAVAQLKVSGALPLDDLEQALAALAEVFPLRIQRLTRYWIRVVPRAA